MKTAAWAVVVVAALSTACGSTSERDAAQVAQEFSTAVAERRFDDACARLAPRARDRIGPSCAAALASLRGGAVRETETWGDESVARAGEHTLFLHEFAAGWLVTGAGCVSRGDQPYQCEVGGP